MDIYLFIQFVYTYTLYIMWNTPFLNDNLTTSSTRVSNEFDTSIMFKNIKK